jgi:DNA-directed RNA polymerase specialized sigma24 family protein
MHMKRSYTDDGSNRLILLADVRELSEGLWSPKEPSPQRRKLCDAVREAVATSLTSKQREVVEGYFFEGLSQGQLATRLGITQQVVHKRLYGAQRSGRRVGGALEKLRQVLSPLLEP